MAKSEPEKRERAILKKLRQAQAVQEEHAHGKTLNEAQRAKVLSIPMLQHELALLKNVSAASAYPNAVAAGALALEAPILPHAMSTFAAASSAHPTATAAAAAATQAQTASSCLLGSQLLSSMVPSQPPSSRLSARASGCPSLSSNWEDSDLLFPTEGHALPTITVVEPAPTVPSNGKQAAGAGNSGGSRVAKAATRESMEEEEEAEEEAAPPPPTPRDALSSETDAWRRTQVAWGEQGGRAGAGGSSGGRSGGRFGARPGNALPTNHEESAAMLERLYVFQSSARRAKAQTPATPRGELRHLDALPGPVLAHGSLLHSQPSPAVTAVTAIASADTSLASPCNDVAGGVAVSVSSMLLSDASAVALTATASSASPASASLMAASTHASASVERAALLATITPSEMAAETVGGAAQQPDTPHPRHSPPSRFPNVMALPTNLVVPPQPRSLLASVEAAPSQAGMHAAAAAPAAAPTLLTIATDGPMIAREGPEGGRCSSLSSATRAAPAASRASTATATGPIARAPTVDAVLPALPQSRALISAELPLYDSAFAAAAAEALATQLHTQGSLDEAVAVATEGAMFGMLEALETAESARLMALSMEDFVLLRLVGKGGYGKVFQVRCLINNQIYAMKVVDKASIERYRSMENITTELSILRTHGEARHPFILGLECAFQSVSKLHFVMEYVPGGMLFAHLRSHEMFSEKMARFYAAEVLLGLEHLHSLSIIYRDLKPENVLICADGNAKLCDFGLAAIGLTAPATHKSASGRLVLVGTTEYMAPEVLRRMQCGQAVDVWALGVLLYEMMTGEAPWWHKEQKELQRKIAHTKLRLPSWFTNEAKALIKGLLTKDPAQRLGVLPGSETCLSDFPSLKGHPFFRNLNWKLLLMCKLEAPFVPTLNAEDPANDVSNFDSKYTLEAPVLSPLRRPLSTEMAEQFEAISLAYSSPEIRHSLCHSLRDSLRASRFSCDSDSSRGSDRESISEQLRILPRK